jgi:methionyl-tRNA formyltransferase
MRALILISGQLIAAKVLHAWLSTGNSVAALWIGSKDVQRVLWEDRMIGLAAPSWSIAAMAQHYNIPIQGNAKLSSWRQACSEIQRLNADVLITAMTKQIVPEDILSQMAGRAVNFHPSVLPYYRGPFSRLGMILDGKAEQYGGVTLHCLSHGIDKGDIVGFRKVPYDPERGLIYWNVCLARAAGDLVQKELQAYLGGTLRPYPQPAQAGSYRKVREIETTLSEQFTASQTRWLCDQLGASGSVRYRSQKNKQYLISHFIRQTDRKSKTEQIGRFTIEFDAVDARVQVARRRGWTLLLQVVLYWLAIVGTRRLGKT